MIVKTDKLNCYIEGVRLPISTLTLDCARNQPAHATFRLSAGRAKITPMIWANALTHITYVDTSEVLLFQGLVSHLTINEDQNILQVQAESVWSALNLNTTFDYTAPKKYGIKNLEDEMTIFLGNEQAITTSNDIIEDSYALSNRYYFLKLENQKADVYFDSEDSEIYKLQYIIDRTPFASLIAFNLFEQIAYDNFHLSKAYIHRLNLLSKITDASSRHGFEFMRKQAELDSAFLTLLDNERVGIAYKTATIKPTSDTGAADVSDLNLSALPADLPYKPISAKAQQKLENTSYNTTQGYKDITGYVTVQQILNAYNTYCKSINVDPNLLIAQAYHESAGFNPYAKSSTGASGWAQFVPGTWREVTGLPLDRRFSILDSIRAQCKYMHQMFTYANGDSRRALSNYVDGPNAKNRPQTPGYLASVSGIYSSFF